MSANSVVYVATDGGAQTLSGSAAGFSTVDVTLVVDGLIVPNAAYRRLIINNTASQTNQFVNWSFADGLVLPPGSHRIQVATALNAGQPATVSGGPGSVLQGQLTIVVVNR